MKSAFFFFQHIQYNDLGRVPIKKSNIYFLVRLYLMIYVQCSRSIHVIPLNKDSFIDDRFLMCFSIAAVETCNKRNVCFMGTSSETDWRPIELIKPQQTVIVNKMLLDKELIECWITMKPVKGIERGSSLGDSIHFMYLIEIFCLLCNSRHYERVYCCRNNVILVTFPIWAISVSVIRWQGSSSNVGDSIPTAI